MYEVDFTGWTRTPEAIKELKDSNFKRFKFHFKRVILSVRYKRWWGLRYCIIDLLKNTKDI